MSDSSGSVAIIYALVFIPLTAFVGLAVDFGRVYRVSSQTQSALDAAALAAGRVAQVEVNDTVNKASAAANAFFMAFCALSTPSAEHYVSQHYFVDVIVRRFE